MAGSPLLGLLAGLAQIPKDVQARKDQNAQRQFTQADNQAKLQADQANAESMQMQAAATKMAVGQQFLKQIGQQATANPKYASDPNYIAGQIARAKQLGVDIPLADGPNGTKVLDMKALSTKPQFANASFDDKLKGMSLPQPQRLQLMQETYDGVDPNDSYFKSAPYTPMSASEKTSMANLPAKLEADLGTGKIDSQGYVNAIKANYTLLKDAGVDPDALLTPQALTHQATRLTDAKIDQLNALGIHLKNEDKTRQLQLQQQMREFGIKTDIQRQEFSQRMSLEAQRVNIAAMNLSYRGQEMDNANQRLALAYQAATQSASRSTQAAVEAAYRVAKDNYDRADNDFSKLDAQIRSTNALNPSYVPDQATLDRMSALKAQMAKAQPLLQAAGMAVTKAASRATSAVTGQRVEPSQQLPATTQQNGKTYYLWPDGNYHTKKPS